MSRMSDLFIQLLNMSYQAGIVICFIILARYLLKLIKAPKKFAYSLWGIALLRMLLPFSFESILSFLPKKTYPISTAIQYETIPHRNTGSAVINDTVGYLLPTTQPLSSVNSIQLWILIAQMIWLLGICVLLIYNTVAFARIKYRLVGSINLEDQVYLADHLETPIVLGLINPRIYLPTGLASNEMEYILQHERAHLKRQDNLWKLLGFITVSVHWFNPLAWIAFSLGCRDMELSCDEYVMKTSKQDIRKEYSASLLRLSVRSTGLSGTPLAFGEGGIKERIKNVLHYKKPTAIAVAAAFIIMIFLAVGLLTNPESNVKSNNRSLKKAVQSITEEQVALNEVVPFAWTSVYTFDPYLSVEVQEKIIGFQSDKLQETVSEGMVQLVFVDGDQVVSSICAYADQLGYSIDLRGEGIDYKVMNINYRRITYNEDAIFSVKSSGDIVALYYVKSRNQLDSVVADPITEENNAEDNTAADHMTADHITIGNSISSYAMFGAPQEVIDEMLETYAQMELSPTSDKPELEKELSVTLSNGDITVIRFSIDSKGVVTLSDDNNINYYRCENGASIYQRIKEIYNNSRNGEGYDSGIYQETSDLEKAVSQAILSQNQGKASTYDIALEAHTTFKVETDHNSVTVYAMALHQEFSNTATSITEEGGSHMPVAITFDRKKDGTYVLQEYWRPVDGSNYASSIADKFPADIYEEAVDTQKYIYEHMQSCYQQVVAYGNINTDLIIENLISEICSSPATASSGRDYIREHEIAYRELRYLGEYTIGYCFPLFAKGGKDDLEGQIMAMACADILGKNSSSNYATGQEWYDETIVNAESD